MLYSLLWCNTIIVYIYTSISYKDYFLKYLFPRAISSDSHIKILFNGVVNFKYSFCLHDDCISTNIAHRLKVRKECITYYILLKMTITVVFLILLLLICFLQTVITAQKLLLRA